jgi:phosphatidylserine/phosphatidylglycerophosphate/cardiolipin synthase-like enzyme
VSFRWRRSGDAPPPLSAHPPVEGRRQLLARARRLLSDDAFQRVAGAPRVPGNHLRVLRDARENYPAWIAAIESARRTVHLEMYIVHNDAVGRRFRDLLVARARAGVKVRVLYDWFGSFRLIGSRMWAPLVAAGGDVRVASPPSLDGPLGWISRDHRKLLTVDGAVAFISGLCIGEAWLGDPARHVEPWRDTGVQFSGPAVADAEAAFAEAWALAGGVLAPSELPRREDIPLAGTVGVRVIPTSPETAGLYRMDLLVAAAARRRLWLTDAYFLATVSYRQALAAAARDGVDVRLLVPHGSDIEWIANVSRTMYRSLLEAGVRIFEWNGPMVHAKSAVADGQWTRVGSTNLNLSSWIGNWELDVAVEDEGVAKEMEEIYLEDLERATEIVLTPRHKVRPERAVAAPGRAPAAASSGSRVLADAARMGSAVGAAVRGHRALGRPEASSLLTVGSALFFIALVTVLFPRPVAYALGALLAAAAAFLLVRGLRLRFGREAAEADGADEGDRAPRDPAAR